MNNTMIKHLNRIPMERHMSDWQIGDLALCADDSPCRHRHLADAAFGIRAGSVLTVVSVRVDHTQDIGLCFAGTPNEGVDWCGYSASRFRKIRPDEHEACEPEFVTLLKRAKRPVMNPLAAVLRDICKPSPAVAAVLIAGPIAKRLNAEAQLENERREQ